MLDQPTRTYRWWLAPAGVAGLAIVMGLPTLAGSFVGGDDHRLVLNHVLVNHPSLEHAVKLFTIWHRDLYQPLALLSFQMEFAVADIFGLFDSGLEGGQWLFHLTNIILHAVNTTLVWLLIVQLHTGVRSSRSGSQDLKDDLRSSPNGASGISAHAVATITAILFAIHPLQTEVVAWTNGRMMLLSTMFGLLALLSFAKWLDDAQKDSAVLTVFWVLLSALSKVRVGLPILLAIVALARYRRVDRRVLSVWTVATLVTGALAVVNILSTSDAKLFSEGAEYLQGPRTVRILMALAFYAQHTVWPVGLASYYPTPPLVAWSDPGTRHALFVLIPTIAFVGIACWRSRVARLGTLWFVATIGATLPFFPARNILAADRYMYLPIIGLFWLLATFSGSVYQRLLGERHLFLRRGVAVVIGILVVVPSLVMCRHVAWFYATPLRKTQRIVDLFPTTPRVWERLGWTHYSLEHFEEAIECGKKELAHTSKNVLSGAYQLIGLSTFHQGHSKSGLDLLRQAVDLDHKSVLAKYRLGMALDELGRTEQAIQHYEAAVEQAPQSNPTIHKLATAYRKVGRTKDAREALEKALANNPDYEVAAIMGLVELDIEENTPESYAAAEQRLLFLLNWMPENSAAWTNLGVARNALDRPNLAIDAYQSALQLDPRNLSAALNIAQLYSAKNEMEDAEKWFVAARAIGIDTVRQAKTIHDFHLSQGDPDECVQFWSEMAIRLPDDPEISAFLAWSHALSGNAPAARALIDKGSIGTDSLPLQDAASTLVDLLDAQYLSATQGIKQLCSLGDKSADARRRFLGGLQFFSQSHPDCPWTFTLAARLLIADGKRETAQASLLLGEQRCKDPQCLDELQTLHEILDSEP